MSTTTWISRGWPPLSDTSPTPSTDSRIRLTRISAISVSVRRLIVFDDNTRLMIAAASGSAFWIIGGSTCGGTFFSAPETFSRTALAASSRSRSSTNRIVMVAEPFDAVDDI